jgi:hypothetical protein
MINILCVNLDRFTLLINEKIDDMMNKQNEIINNKILYLYY